MIKIVVPISGGKDSQATMKLAIESYPVNQITGLFCDTKFEHPITYQHIELIKKKYGVKIETVSNGSVPEMIIKNNRFPDSIARFCTRDLKIKPSNDFYLTLAEKRATRPVRVEEALDKVFGALDLNCSIASKIPTLVLPPPVGNTQIPLA
jgi:3'-phosphoadenosine 5'-phosphosulfate sulfotransferase (PAPS reductase)/FAD synthetase